MGGMGGYILTGILDCFESRFEDGYILETDFSQLEVVGVAFLSQDENLMQDIIEEKDLHCMSASFLFGEDYETIYAAVQAGDTAWIKKRKASKSPTFQLQYGAGYKSIAKKCGLTENQAKTFIENYYGRYHGLKDWQDGNIATVQSKRKPSGKHTTTGYPIGEAYLPSITGRQYYFQEQENPAWLAAKGKPTSFQPTQIKNYPSQGFATGDLVPMCVGELYYELKSNPALKDNALLINTVHDSVLLDVQAEVLEQTVQVVEEVLTSAGKYLKLHFDINFNLPIRVESSWGRTWADAK